MAGPLRLSLVLCLWCGLLPPGVFPAPLPVGDGDGGDGGDGYGDEVSEHGIDGPVLHDVLGFDCPPWGGRS